MADMQFLKPRKICYWHLPKNGARNVLTAGCARATGLIESSEHGFQSNARLPRCGRSAWRIHSFDRLHFQEGLPSEDALEDEDPHDRTKKGMNIRKCGRSAGRDFRRFIHEASHVLYDLRR